MATMNSCEFILY